MRDNPLSRGELAWEITSSRCYLASYVSRSLPASADGALLVADFDPKSATFGVWPTNGSSSSRNNILRNRFFHEVAAQNTLEGHAGLE